MARLTYAEQLAHPNWQRRRLHMLEAANWKCSACSDGEAMLHVHHRQYFKGRMAWEYTDDELQVLCHRCHKSLHAIDDRIKSILALVPAEQVLALLAGYYSALLTDDELRASVDEANKAAFLGGFLGSELGHLPDEVQQELFAVRDRYLNSARAAQEGNPHA